MKRLFVMRCDVGSSVVVLLVWSSDEVGVGNSWMWLPS